MLPGLPLEIEGREALLPPEFEGMDADGKLLDELELDEDEGILDDELEELEELELELDEDEGMLGDGMLGDEDELELDEDEGMLGIEEELDDC